MFDTPREIKRARKTQHKESGRYAVECPYCFQLVKSPFTPNMYWRDWEPLVAKWADCQNCGWKMRIR